MTGKKYDTLQTHTHTHKVLLHIKINELKFPRINMGSSGLISLGTVTICKHSMASLGFEWQAFYRHQIQKVS